MVFSSSYYRQLTEHDYKRGAEGQHEITGVDRPSDHKWTDGYERYCRQRNQQQAVYKGGEYLAFLIFTWGSLPNLRNVILTDILSTRDLPNEQIQGFSTWNIGPACPLAECTLSDAQHQDFQVEPASGFVAYAQNNPWDSILLILSITNLGLAEFSYTPISDFRVPLKKVDDNRCAIL